MSSCDLDETRRFCHSYHRNITLAQYEVTMGEVQTFIGNFNKAYRFNVNKCLLRSDEFIWTLLLTIMKLRWDRNSEWRAVFTLGVPLILFTLASNFIALLLFIRRLGSSELYTYQISLTFIDIVTIVLTSIYAIHSLFVYGWEYPMLCRSDASMVRPFMNYIQSLMMGSVLAANLLLAGLSMDYVLYTLRSCGSGHESEIGSTSGGNHIQKWFAKHQSYRVLVINLVAYLLGFIISIVATQNQTIVINPGKTEPYGRFCFMIEDNNYSPALHTTKQNRARTDYCVKSKRGTFARFYPEILSNTSLINRYREYLAWKKSLSYFERCLEAETGLARDTFSVDCKRIEPSSAAYALYALILLLSYFLLTGSFGVLVYYYRAFAKNAVQPFSDNAAAAESFNSSIGNAQTVNNNADKTTPAVPKSSRTDDPDPKNTENFIRRIRLVFILETCLAILQMFSSLANAVFDVSKKQIGSNSDNALLLIVDVDTIVMILDIWFGVCFILACSLNFIFFISSPLDLVRRLGQVILGRREAFRAYLRRFHPWNENDDKTTTTAAVTIEPSHSDRL